MIRRQIRNLASLRLTVLAMTGLLLAILMAYFDARVPYVWITLPLALLAANLLAALATNARLRSEPALVLFHVALLMLCVLAGLDATLRFEGRVELTEGQALFADRVMMVERGIWHRPYLESIAVEQGVIEVAYAPGMVRQNTRSVVYVGAGQDREDVELSESKALVTHGYRFSTTPNKGFAVLLSWRDVRGAIVRGAVHFPSYPAHEWRQRQSWQTPAGEQITLVLRPLSRAPTNSDWLLSSSVVRADVTIVGNGPERVLAPGQWQPLRSGALRLDDVRLWMGYRIDYQPLLQWMLLAALCGIVSLAWHFYRRLWRPAAFPVTDSARNRSGPMARI